jgi:hypothetical protein
MPVLSNWDLFLDVDGVLRGQGADPTAIRQRNSRLVKMAEGALEEGHPLLKPYVLYHTFEVERLRHKRLHLKGGGSLAGPLIATHLGPAQRVIVMVCTVGATLEEHASDVMTAEIVRGLALEGVGSAATEALANAACRRFEVEAAAEGLQTSIPLSPGMIGWTVADGQPQIFSLLDTAQIGVALTPSAVMIPRKSLSMVLGIGPEMSNASKTCDYCAMRDTCRYQDHYDPTSN